MSEWAISSIDTACEILDSMRVPISEDNRRNMSGTIPYYGANGVQGYIDKYIFNEPLVLIAEDGGFFDEYDRRPIAYRIYGKSWVNNHAHVLRAKQGYALDFIYYSLVHKNILPYIKGGTRAKLNQQELKRIEIYHPVLLQTQKKISTILNCVEDVIEKTEAAIEKYKAIKAGMMQDLFTRGIDTQTGKLRPTIEEAPELYKESELGWIPKEWDATEFKDACLEYINGGTPSTKNASNWVGNIPWITGADFLESFEVGFIRRHINEDALRYSSSHLIREGNILLVTRTGVGKLAIAPFDVAISQDITGIILDPSQYCVEFFYYYLQILVEDFKKMNQGTSINGIIRSDLEATLILKPSLDEQKQIAAVLRALDENLKKEQSNLSKYRDLKMGLMADLLTGKVRVNLNHDKVENR